MNPFPYIKKAHRSQEIYPCDIYTFTNLLEDVMILEVYYYPHSVFVIKFFRKKHKLSQKRYSDQYSKKEIEVKGFINGSKNFIRTLDTALTIGIDYLKKEDFASFAFMGAPKPSELSRQSNDGTVPNTKRHSIYKSYTLRYFSDSQFTFIDSNTASIFFIRNEKNRDNLPKTKISSIIKTEIIPNL